MEISGDLYASRIVLIFLSFLFRGVMGKWKFPVPPPYLPPDLLRQEQVYQSKCPERGLLGGFGETGRQSRSHDATTQFKQTNCETKLKYEEMPSVNIPCKSFVSRNSSVYVIQKLMSLIGMIGL